MKDASLIGIDLGATNIRVAKVSDDTITEIVAEKIESKTDKDHLINQLKKLIHQVITGTEKGIGIGVPSVVDVEKGIVYDVQNIPSWVEVPLKDILEAEFNIPVFINNDANCFVLGEKYFGKAKQYHSVVGLILGTGFGSGLVLNNLLYSGANCGAGEVGMLPYKDSIFEHYCCGQFFEKIKKTDGIKAYQKALEGDEEALQMYRELGTHVGNGIKAVLYAYDPQIIVLGGSVANALPLFKKSMYEALADFAYPKSLENLTIVQSELENSAVFGAAALVIQN